MPKYTRAPAGQAPIVPAVTTRPAGQQVPQSVISTGGPYGAVYSTATVLITADGAIIPAYHPAYGDPRPRPAGKGRA